MEQHELFLINETLKLSNIMRKYKKDNIANKTFCAMYDLITVENENLKKEVETWKDMYDRARILYNKEYHHNIKLNKELHKK